MYFEVWRYCRMLFISISLKKHDQPKKWTFLKNNWPFNICYLNIHICCKDHPVHFFSNNLAMIRPQNSVPNAWVLPHFVGKYLNIVVFLVCLNNLNRLPASIHKIILIMIYTTCLTNIFLIMFIIFISAILLLLLLK